MVARDSVLKWIRGNLIFEMKDRNVILSYYNSCIKQYRLPYTLLGHIFHKDHSTIIEMEKRIKKNDESRTH